MDDLFIWLLIGFVIAMMVSWGEDEAPEEKCLVNIELIK